MSPTAPLTREVRLHLEHCSGCQACVELYPAVFGWDETMELPYLQADQGRAEDLRKAAAFCPRDCIEVVEPGQG